jgi:hypothetical protein
MLVLYNVAHQNARIKSFDGNAWIRVLGFFQTRKLALEQSKRISASVEGGMEIRIAPIESFRLIMNQNYAKVIDSVREEKKVNFLYNFHKDQKEKTKAEVESNALNKKIGNLVFSPSERREYYKELGNGLANNPVQKTVHFNEEDTVIETEDEKENEGEKLVKCDYSIDTKFSKLQSFPKDFQIRCQNYFAMAYVPDYQASLFESHDLDVWKLEYEDEKTRLRNLELKTLLQKFPEFKLPPVPSFIPQDASTYSEIFLKKFQEDAKESYEKIVWESCGESYLEMTQRLDNALIKWTKKNPVPETKDKEEPMVAFLTWGETSEEIHKYIEANKQDEWVRDYDVACVSMYEWIRVSNFRNPAIKKEYREEILSNIFKNRDEQLKESARLQKLNPGVNITEVEV